MTGITPSNGFIHATPAQPTGSINPTDGFEIEDAWSGTEGCAVDRQVWGWDLDVAIGWDTGIAIGIGN